MNARRTEMIFYHTLDIFTTHWTFLQHIGHLYDTLDIFTTHCTSLPHIGPFYHTFTYYLMIHEKPKYNLTRRKSRDTE